TAAVRAQRRVLLIAGGVGITPLRALLESLPATRGDLTLVYRVSTMGDVVFRHELGRLAAARGARPRYRTGRRAELGLHPLSAGELRANLPHLTRHDVYVCGPAGMTATVIGELRRAGVPRRQIHHESFEF